MLAWPMIRELMAIRERLEECLDDSALMAGGQAQPANGTFSPSADLYEDDENVIIIMEVPGVEADTVELTLEENRLRVVGKTIADNTVNEGGRFLRMERSEGGFVREFELPDIALGDEPTGTLERGVLIVHLPKAPGVKRRRIEVVEEDL